MRRRQFGALCLLSTLLLSASCLASADAADDSAPGGGSETVSKGFSFNAGIDLSETYLTNVLGTTAAGEQKGDYDSRAALTLGMHEHTLRLTADATYTLSADYFLRNSSHLRVTNNFDGLADLVIIPGNLLLDARAFATPIYVSSLGALAPPNASLPGNASANVLDTYGYEAQPKLMFRLGDFAKSDLTVAYGAVYLVQPSDAPPLVPTPGFTPPPANLSSFSITETLSNGTYFNRLNWDLIGSDAEQSQSVGGLVTREGLADFKYAVSREFWVLTKVGYETFDASPSLTRNLNGIVAMGGVRFTLGPAFDGSFLAGRQYNSPSYMGNLHYEMSSTSAIVAEVSDSVTTPAARLLDNLETMAATDQGTLVNSADQLSGGAASTFATFNATPADDTSFDNVIARYRAAQASFLYEVVRTHLILTGFDVTRDTLSPEPAGTDLRQTSVGLSFSASRNLTPVTTAMAQVAYYDQSILGGHDDIIEVSGQITYLLAPDMSLYANASYQQRMSSSSLVVISPLNGNLSDAQFTIGIHRQLF